MPDNICNIETLTRAGQYLNTLYLNTFKFTVFIHCI